LSDADRLARLFSVIEFLGHEGSCSVGELARRFGGGCRSLYDDLIAAWLTEDPCNTGIFPFHVVVDYFERGDPESVPITKRRVWLEGPPHHLPWRSVSYESRSRP
jgi:hypothetical protein